jgi:hypothetical protein
MIRETNQSDGRCSLKTTWISLGIAVTLPVIFIAFGAVGVALASSDHEYQAMKVMDAAKSVAMIAVPIGAALIAFLAWSARSERD